MEFSRRAVMKSTLGLVAFPQWLLALDSQTLPPFERGGSSTDVDPAYLSNGLIGIRPGPIPLLPSPACVSGFVYAHPDHRVESLSPAPYPLTTDLRLNGISLLEHPERCRLKRQSLDMNNGELTTDFTFDAGGFASATVEVRQIALRSEPSLLLQRTVIRASASSRLEFAPLISTEGVPGNIVREGSPKGGRSDRVMLFRSLGGLSELGVAVLVTPAEGFQLQQNSAAYTAQIQPDTPYTFFTLASLVSSFYHREPDIEAIRLVNWGSQTGPEQLVEDNRKAWRELWKSRIQIEGSSGDQQALDAAFFYLHASNHRSNLTGMPAFGLSSSRYYFGHSFWDTETWCFLPLLLSSPETARSLLAFRRRGLDAALRNASLFGYRGAQFPWEAAPTDGEEVTPVFASTGWAEQHVVADVALAFWQYQMATGDEAFLVDATWPVLRSVAEWIESRGGKTSRGFEILNIMGPNEAKNGLNNSAYVNIACTMVMKAAIKCASMVGVRPPSSWERIATSMFLPVNSEGVLAMGDKSPQNAFDDLSFLLPFDVEVPRSTLERTWVEYRKQKADSSMIGFAKAAVAGLAAFMGDRALAAQLFRDTWAPDTLQPFGMMREYTPQTYGCFLTNEGSLLRSAMFAFTGLRVGDGDWNKYEACLPENWKSIQIDCVYVKGESKRVVARHGKKAEIL